MKDCYCCSGKSFEECCHPFLTGKAKPPTAEALMRSRFSAYATVNIEYLLKTIHPSTRKFHDRIAIQNWSENNSWQKLEIVSTIGGNSNEKTGMVEFKAYFLDSNNKENVQSEKSNFVKELGKWFYVDGKFS